MQHISKIPKKHKNTAQEHCAKTMQFQNNQTVLIIWYNKHAKKEKYTDTVRKLAQYTNVQWDMAKTQMYCEMW